ncbi:acetamidase [Naviculisporaceae sp. PSN 640]
MLGALFKFQERPVSIRTLDSYPYFTNFWILQRVVRCIMPRTEPLFTGLELPCCLNLPASSPLLESFQRASHTSPLVSLLTFLLKDRNTMPPKRAQKKTKTWQDVAAEAGQHRETTIHQVLGDEDFGLLQSVNIQAPEGHHRASAAGLLPECQHILSASQLQITNLVIKDLTKLIRTGQISAEEVATAFLRRSAIAQQTVNCITELLGERALSRARELDQTRRGISNTAKGPLHGIPISVKSHIGIEGRRMPAGYIAWWNNTCPRDALVVQILERAGAIVHARTTEPQSMMQLECVSNLYGPTLNPHNVSLSSGGSSGGEGALVAMGGSSIGVGSDVGGSIRVPAAACGIFGLKPTAFRVPTTGWSSTPPGADPIPTVLGPISRDLEGIELFMETVLAAESWKVEPALVPLPWRQVTLDRPIKIGIALHDGTVLPHPPITRTLQELADKIRAIPGFDVVDFPLYKVDEAWAIASSLYFTDGGAADLSAMAESGEPILPLTNWIINQTPGVKNLSRAELEYWLEEREEYRLEYAAAWNSTGTWDEKEGEWVNTVDVLLCPVMPGVATRHGTAKYWSYSAVWNLLDYPALAFPAGRVDKDKDAVKSKRIKFMSDHDRWNKITSEDDPDVFADMPAGVQAVGRRFEDEKVVAVVRILQDRGCLGSQESTQYQ